METEIKNILLIEDNPGDARLIKEILKSSELRKADIYWTENLTDSIDYLKNNPVDIVLSDLSLPDSNGLNTVSSIFYAFPETVVIALTGHEDIDLAVQTLKIGAQDYLFKNKIDDQILSRAIQYAVEKKKNELALRNSEEKYRLIVDTMNEGIIVTNNDDRILFVNQSTCLIYGYSENELIGQIGYEILEHPAYKNIVIEKTKSRLNGVSDSFDVKGIKKSGESIWVRIIGSPLFNNNGIVIGSVGIVSDITHSKLAYEKLAESELKYKRFFDEDLTGDFITTPDGNILFCNDALAKILKYDKKEDLFNLNAADFYFDKSDRMKFLNEIISKKKIANLESCLKAKDGSSVFVVENVIGSFDQNGNLNQIIGYMFDITARKLAEDRQELFSAILEILNRKNDWQNLIKDIMNKIKSFIGFDAVGIRLKHGDDYPYFIQTGFADAFIKEENFLCAKSKDGSVIKDKNGLPVLECTCGVVLSGKTDISKPYFTDGGSFWTNQSTDLLDLTPIEDPRTNPRNNCIHSGYISVALIPIHSGEEIIGLLQLNDKQPNKFTLDSIQFFEKIGSAIGVAIKRMLYEEKIKVSEKKYHDLTENLKDLIYTADPKTFAPTFVNRAIEEIYGYSVDEWLNNPQLWVKTIHNEDRERVIQQVITSKQEGANSSIEYRIIKKDGTERWVNNKLNWEKDDCGKIVSLGGIVSDITERKHNEEELLLAKDRMQVLVEGTPHLFFYVQDVNGYTLYVSPSIIDITGRNIDEWKEQKHWFATDSKINVLARQRTYENLNGNINFDPIFVEVKHTDGRPILLEVYEKPIFRNDIVVGLQGVAHNITERKRDEEELLLRNKLNLLKAKIWESVSSSSMNRPDLINLMLAETGNILNISRAAFLEFDEKKKSFITQYQWYLPEAGPTKDVSLPLKYVDHYLGQDFVQIPQQLNKTARLFAAPILKQFNIKSWLAVIYGNKNNPKGIFAFTDCVNERFWTDIEKEALLDLSKILESYSIKYEAEEALREKEERFRSVAQSANDAIVTADSKGIILDWNKGAEKIFGYMESEIVGQSLTSIMPENYRYPHNNGIKRIEKSGEKHIIGNTVELHGLHKNGTVFPLELSIADWETSKGKYFTGIMRDITKRIRVEAEIEMLAQSLKSVNESVSITDMEDKIIFVNQSFTKTYGYEKNELLGQNMSIVRSSNNLPEIVNKILPATISGGWKGELLNKRKDGSEFPVYLSTTIIKDKNGKHIGLIGVAEDITERKRIEKELIKAKEKAESSDKLKSEFLAQMSHEIRTPLNIILSNIEFIKDDFGHLIPPDDLLLFDSIDSSCQRIIRTINLILDSSEIQTGLFNLKPVAFDLRQVIEKLFMEFQPAAVLKSLDFTFSSTSLCTSIIADHYSVTQIFSNLLDNAIKYTQNGKIEILIFSNTSSDISVSIKDTGIGMSKEFQSKMFDPFLQEDQGYSRSFDGNGLGLTLVKKYCELNNAVIEVESEKNVGSTFKVTFKC